MWLLTLLSLLAPAHAGGTGRLIVNVDKPVAVMVDGQLLEAEEGAMRVVGNNLFGRHEVAIATAFGKPLWSGMVDIPDGYEVRCRWRNKAFDCYAAEPMAVVAVPAGGEPLGSQPVGATTSVTAPGMGVQITESAGGDSVSMSVGGMGGMGMSVSAGASGSTTTTTTTTTTTGMPFFGVVVEESTTTTTVDPGFQDPGFVDGGFVEAAPACNVPAQVSLVLRSTDGEWADVLVDGKVVAEFRNQDEKTVTITPGLHTIEVREFMEDSPYARGRLDTGCGARVTLGIAEGQPVTAYDTDGWMPQ